jgi:hypothetical protein
MCITISNSSMSFSTDPQCNILRMGYRTKLCNFNVDLTYPQNDPLPWIRIDNHGDPARKASQDDADAAGENDAERKSGRSLSFEREVHSRAEKRYGLDGMTQLRRRDVAEERRELGRRSLEGRANGTIDAWYGCELFDEMVDYAVNYTWPWCEFHSSLTMGVYSLSAPHIAESKEVDTFDLPDAVNPDAPTSPAWFLNSPFLLSLVLTNHLISVCNYRRRRQGCDPRTQQELVLEHRLRVGRAYERRRPEPCVIHHSGRASEPYRRRGRTCCLLRRERRRAVPSFWNTSHDPEHDVRRDARVHKEARYAVVRRRWHVCWYCAYRAWMDVRTRIRRRPSDRSAETRGDVRIREGLYLLGWCGLGQAGDQGCTRCSRWRTAG